jgi:hypothetical protein
VAFAIGWHILDRHTSTGVIWRAFSKDILFRWPVGCYSLSRSLLLVQRAIHVHRLLTRLLLEPSSRPLAR